MSKTKTTQGLDIRITRAKLDDAPKTIEYMNYIAGESDHFPFSENEFNRTVEEEEIFIKWLRLQNRSAMFVGKINGEIVSIGNISSEQRKRISHHSEIALSVKSKFCSQGIGRLMLNEMINFAKTSRETEILHLMVKEDNEYAIKLYESFGFKEFGRFEKYFKINDKYYDQIFMNLYL